MPFFSNKLTLVILVVLGPSGCGKGTQAALIAEHYGLVHISTGDILRREFEAGSVIGLQAYEWWGKGRWAPTETVGKLLTKELSLHPQGNLVLEGWPRLSEQTQVLEKFLEEKGLAVDRVFYLKTPRATSLERIKGRVRKALDEGRNIRPDDTDEVIDERLKSYYRTIKPILSYYRKRGILEIIDNRPSINEVFREIIRRIDDQNKNG